MKTVHTQERRESFLPSVAYWMWKGNTEKVVKAIKNQIKEHGPISADDWKYVADLHNELESNDMINFCKNNWVNVFG